MKEVRNPFTAAKITRIKCPSDVYAGSTGDARGEPGHIMSRSELMDFRECPQRYLRGYHDEDTDATEFGTLTDCVVLQPMAFHKQFVVRPATYKDAKTGEEKKWTMAANVCKEWVAKHAATKTVISPEENASAHGVLERLIEDPATKELLDCSMKQVFIQGEYFDEETEIVVPVKALIDIVPDVKNKTYGKTLCDLKTTRSAHPLAWQAAVDKYNLHVQGAMYLWLYQAATREDRTDFLHLLVENYPPFEPGHRLLSFEFLELGRMRLLATLRDYCQCLDTDIWPGYERPGNCLPTLPGWMVTEPSQRTIQFAD